MTGKKPKTLLTKDSLLVLFINKLFEFINTTPVTISVFFVTGTLLCFSLIQLLPLRSLAKKNLKPKTYMFLLSKEGLWCLMARRPRMKFWKTVKRWADGAAKESANFLMKIVWDSTKKLAFMYNNLF